MGSSRKRPRPNPSTVADPIDVGEPATEDTATKPPTPATPIIVGSTGNASTVKTSLGIGAFPGLDGSITSKQLRQKSSWYGTWPRKATPSTQVARETILADTPKNVTGPTADLSRFEPRKTPTATIGRPPSMSLGKSKETLEITLGGALEDDSSLNKDEMESKNTKGSKANSITEASSSTTEATTVSKQVPLIPEEPPAPPALQPVLSSSQTTTAQRPVTASGWFGGWLSRPYPQPAQVPEDSSSKSQETEQRDSMDPNPQEPATFDNETQPNTIATGSSSWFGLWPAATASAPTDTKEAQTPVRLNKPKEDTIVEDAPTADGPPVESRSWAFWSTDPSKKPSNSVETSEVVGEASFTGTASQDSPVPAKLSTQKDNKKGKLVKQARSQPTEIDETVRLFPQTEASTSTPTLSTSSGKVLPPNLILPSVRQTYSLVENPSILQQIASLLLRGHQTPAKHVYLVKDPPIIRKAVAIGVHGLFPAAFLRTVIGQPTGTSIKFAEQGKAAIRRWTDAHGSPDCEIDMISLEGEGTIEKRVQVLWDLLLNWIDLLRKADFILLACHSQGVPVGIMIVAKLIEFGVVTNARIGICAMAGVSLGPFPDYRSRLFDSSTGELFEFGDPDSIVSKRYEDSLRALLKYGARVAYCGSIDDQLVSMESSIFATATHPYIFRSVFVDGRIHAPDFLSHLVGFALKLRNLGVSDHGLIRELSAPLAGSLYSGEGHSRLYDEGKVYDIAVEHALETTSIGNIPLDLKKYQIPNSNNPYVLPWIMRGLLEEDFVKTELSTETTELLKQFNAWKPATKVLRDVKYRLEAVRSKL